MEGDKEKYNKVDGDSTSILIEDGDSTSILIEDGGMVEKLRSTITGKLVGESPLPASCCIFRVPKVIRRQKKEAYEPDVVSIGPYHRGGGEKFQLMENVKGWYLQCLLSSCSSTDISLEKFIQVFMVMELGKSARDCYAEPLDHLSEEDFIQMMILDGCFLIELFRKQAWSDLQNENDPVFNVSCMRGYLLHDILLLENQLPWSVLECLYNLTANSPSQREASLTELVLNFFKQSKADELMLNNNFEVPCKILHILDLIRTVIVYGLNETEECAEDNRQQKSEPKLFQRIPNATSLSEAGVEFKKSHQNNNKLQCIMNIEFKNGVFTIPPLGIDEHTGPLFRNLIAFEQCHHSLRLQHKITSYAVLMDNLIDSSKDVDFLCEKGILANWLSPEDAAQFFNKLYNDTTVNNFYYQGLSDNVNKYYNTKWHKLMEKLRRDYFSTPWAVISFIVAFILLVRELHYWP